MNWISEWSLLEQETNEVFCSSNSSPSLIVRGDPDIEGVYFRKSDSLYVHEAGGFASLEHEQGQGLLKKEGVLHYSNRSGLMCKGWKGRRNIVVGPLDGGESLCEQLTRAFTQVSGILACSAACAMTQIRAWSPSLGLLRRATQSTEHTMSERGRTLARLSCDFGGSKYCFYSEPDL